MAILAISGRTGKRKLDGGALFRIYERKKKEEKSVQGEKMPFVGC